MYSLFRILHMCKSVLPERRATPFYMFLKNSESVNRLKRLADLGILTEIKGHTLCQGFLQARFEGETLPPPPPPKKKKKNQSFFY